MPARQHDTKAMDVIPYEKNSFYIFDHAYNDFGRLFTINGVGAYFVVRGRKNNDFRSMRRKRRMPAGVLSDAIGYMEGQLTTSKYPEKITMANRRPIPLKDEPTVPLDELQEQISKLIAVVNSLVERTAAEKHQSDDRRIKQLGENCRN